MQQDARADGQHLVGLHTEGLNIEGIESGDHRVELEGDIQELGFLCDDHDPMGEDIIVLMDGDRASPPGARRGGRGARAIGWRLHCGGQ